MSDTIPIRLTVNGDMREGAAEPRKTLADFLREDLDLTGTHLGCEHGVCGACTVLARRRAGALVPDARRAGPGREHHDDRGPGCRRRHEPAAGGAA